MAILDNVEGESSRREREGGTKRHVYSFSTLATDFKFRITMSYWLVNSMMFGNPFVALVHNISIALKYHSRATCRVGPGRWDKN